MKNTVLKLRYADASNWKSEFDFILSGEINDEQIAIIAKRLSDGESLIANQLGLPTVSEEFSSNYNFPTEDDHVWTDIEQFSMSNEMPSVEEFTTLDEPTDPNYTVEKFIENIKSIDFWEEDKEFERLRIPV